MKIKRGSCKSPQNSATFRSMYTEVQLDSLVGPTHHFAGLSLGNLASMESKGQISSPKKAALEGIEKMLFVASLGVPQLFVPPQERPVLSFLKSIGFQSLEEAFNASPELALAAFSSSFMWMANSATFAPSLDTKDKKAHLTPANLASNIHRHLEVRERAKHLQKLFPEPLFHHHSSLPSARGLYDEGAANHTRLAPTTDTAGLHLFVYGGETGQFVARQSKKASEAVCRLHELPKEHILLLEQNREAIDKGVFHNDVISVGNFNFFFSHEKAFTDPNAFDLISTTYKNLFQRDLQLLIVKEEEIPLELAVKTYLFNTQIISLKDGSTLLIAPRECEENKVVKSYLEKIRYFSKIKYLPLNESMKNGGGPACLRLRLLLNHEEREAIPKQYWIDEEKGALLTSWVEKHYPDSLSLKDFQNPTFLEEVQDITQGLNSLLK